MHRSLLAILVLGMLCLSAGSGCIRSYREARGVTGRLIDAGSGQPIAQVPVTVTIDDHRSKAVSSDNGSFQAKPRYRLVFWIIGDWAYGSPVIEIVSDGYEPYQIGDHKWRFQEQDDYVQLGDVHLRKSQPTSFPTKAP